MIVVEPPGLVIPSLCQEHWVPLHMRTRFVHQLQLLVRHRVSMLHLSGLGRGGFKGLHRGLWQHGVQKHIIHTRVLDQWIIARGLHFPLFLQKALHFLTQHCALRSTSLGNALAFHKREIGGRLPFLGSFQGSSLLLLLCDACFVLLRQVLQHGAFTLNRGLDAFALHPVLLNQFLHHLSAVLSRQGLLLLLLLNQLFIFLQEFPSRHRQGAPASFCGLWQQPVLHLTDGHGHLL
mmetsp:Transcript_78048/g.172302  ORF Transcript_78048/g.172302 Transcript_78048/m.172302 type:complete len:235 (-) Transcript_78048:116-820(-)